MENLKFYLKNSIIIIGFLSFTFWIVFIFCCFLALGSDGPYGTILESGVWLIKNHPIIAILSLIPTGFFIRLISKM